MSLNKSSDAQQVIGREGETATFLSRCLLTFSLRVFGFAPRHLRRYAGSRIARNLSKEE